ncbi:MAG: hypothetical protein E6J90_45405 [Deltaproteobacteria bacterium]|nr:MAG: hypothetical protein E6J91_42725 [Deltaproteobacteria bacterium]TMQ06741.1 MAG: hypothetical protein E6J90_45405 [Deltaproteobacteria bacterium]
MTRPPSSGSASAQGARRRSRTGTALALHPDDHAALTDQVARFETEIRELALAAVRAIVEKELERRAKQPRGRPARTADRADAAPAARPRDQAGSAAAQEPAPAAAAGSPEATPGVPSHKRKRIPWTRESIVSELATWMLSGTAIDAAFVARHGPPGLVAAARRIFGRFEAALNVAGLHASKIAPEEPPAR